MNRKSLLLILLVITGLLVSFTAFAEQKIKLDDTATLSLPDTFEFDQKAGETTWYKDTTNKVAVGHNLQTGHVSFTALEKQLKKAGYKSVKEKTVNGVTLFYGSKASTQGRTRFDYYFNTNSGHYVILAMIYDESSAAAKKTADKVISSIKVKDSEKPETDLPLNVGAPAFAWTGVGGKKIASSTHGGKDLVMIYGTSTATGTTVAFLDEFKSYIPELKKKDIYVLVGLDGEFGATDAIMKSMEAKYSGITCGRIPTSYKDITDALESIGIDYSQTGWQYPLIILRSRSNRIKYFRQGDYDKASDIANKALLMAASDVPALPPEADPVEQEEPEQKDDEISAEGGNYKLYKSKKAADNRAVLIGPETDQTTSILMPAKMTVSEVLYTVTGIGDNAFKGNKKLKEITIGIEVTSIGKNAFNGCKKLKTIRVKTTKLTEKNIGKNAFKNLPKDVTIILEGTAKTKMSTYKKWFQDKGLPKTAVFK